MKVFLTGGSGYIGSAVAIALKKAGHDVRALVRSEAKGKALHQAGVKLVVGDLKDPGGYSAAAWGCAAFVHTAIDYGKDTSALDAKTVQAAKDLLRGQVGGTFIYTSGCWIYGSTGDDPVDENSTIKPIRASEWRVPHEKQALALADDGIRSVVVRPAIVYGGVRGGIPAMFFKGAPTVGDGANKWPMVHIDDLGELYVRLVERAPARSVWNAVDASRLTQREIAEAASKTAGKDGVKSAKPDGTPFQEALSISQVLSSEKARNELEWRPRHESFTGEAELLYKTFKSA